MPDHAEIYAKHADEYDRLVAREDHQGHILQALNRIVPLAGTDVVELGAGTGRLTCLLAPLVRSIHAFDGSPHMLDLARVRLRRMGARNGRLAVCDHRRMPLGDEVADVALAGWSISYLKTWARGNWEPEVEQALAEMRRVVRGEGRVILLESLGTGSEVPEVPPEMAVYYAHLDQRGFKREWIRTDYLFRDRAEGERLAGFFFGARIREKLVETGDGVVLPECTGLWWRAGP